MKTDMQKEYGNIIQNTVEEYFKEIQNLYTVPASSVLPSLNEYLYRTKQVFFRKDCDYNKLIEELENANNIFGDEPEIFYLKGLAYSILNNNDKAIIEFKKTLEITGDKKDVRTLTCLGIIYQKLKDDDEASICFDKAKNIDERGYDIFVKYYSKIIPQ